VKLQTIPDILFLAAERNLAQQMLHQRAGAWHAISGQDLYQYVVGTARQLGAWGIRKGDRVALLSENRYEWAVTDYAALSLGAVDVPIYPTLTAEQTAYILRDSGCRVAFVSTAEQLHKVLSIKGQTGLEKLVVMDEVQLPEAVPMRGLMESGPRQRDPEFDTQARQVATGDLATIIYTSGTTGTPKGVMLTHANLVRNLDHTLDMFETDKGDSLVSFLPLSHITARHVDYGMVMHQATVAYCPDINQLPAVLQEIKPTFFVAVPRVYEKIYNQVLSKVQAGLKKKLYTWAIAVGRAHRDEVLAGKQPASLSWKLADKLMFSKVKQAMGGRTRCYISGGAPLGPDLALWFASIGIVIHQGYGLTETSPVIALNYPGVNKVGTVGKPLPNAEVKLAADGEILTRGPCVFQGYWNAPEETRNTFTDGWFKTGDIGALDAEGFLSVTDRKKDLLKTSGGKFIAPQPIENALNASPLVGQAVIIGDKRRFASVLISPHFPVLEDWAAANGIRFASRPELVENERVRALFEGIVADVSKNLAQFERPKKVLLVPDEFTIADGTLTPTLKLKRRVVEERYREQIEALYAEAADPGRMAEVT
jgi:long-chain acyl-CoA synthetase